MRAEAGAGGGQAEAHSAGVAVAGRLQPLERRKDPLQRIRGNAGAW
jgi:hypothetical protein